MILSFFGVNSINPYYSRMKRYLLNQISQDLQKKMVFLSGPLHIGKTTLAKQIVPQKEAYLNWDIPKDKERILNYQIPLEPLVILDEIHKYHQWRNFLKGLYDDDTFTSSFLVTGSARLDVYRYGGDSLQGRYHPLKMHPLSVAELDIQTPQELQDLLELSGFPEPFFSGSKQAAQRCSLEYRKRVIYDEITSLEVIKDLGQLNLLVLSLPKRVGSPLSINALQEDLQVSHKTVERWITILENLYMVFRISPFGYPILRAVKKEQKLYHYDWSLVPDEGTRFENLIACHLLKWIDFENQTQGNEMELRYFKDNGNHEVDFVIIKNNEPLLLIEVKMNDSSVSSSLRYLKKRFPKARALQLLMTNEFNFVNQDGIHVCPAIEFLRGLI